jgi:hypothetical protein
MKCPDNGIKYDRSSYFVPQNNVREGETSKLMVSGLTRLYACDQLMMIIYFYFFDQMLAFSGLRETDPRLKECMTNFENVLLHHDSENKSTDYGGPSLDKKSFKE